MKNLSKLEIVFYLSALAVTFFQLHEYWLKAKERRDAAAIAKAHGQ